MNDKQHANEIELVTSGAYRSAYLIYARKSTDDADNQKNSIQYQRAENARFARASHLPIASVTLQGFCTDGVIAERHSGFKETADLSFGEGNMVQYWIERPKFHRLVQFLNEGYFKGVIILCWDRASRNRGDDTILRKLMKAGVDIRFALTQYDESSAGELHKDIDGMFAEHHSRVTREKVKLTIRSKRAQGYCTYKAGAGYLNEGQMEHKPFDPERAPILRRLFEKADQTNWSLSDLRRWVIEQGFTMPPARRRRTKDEMLADEEGDDSAEIEKICRLPTVADIHRILTSRFYTGMVRGNDGQWVKSNSHQALVSTALFERVQVKLASRRTSVRYDKKLDYLFRGFIRCACGRIYTPYEQKGITYYGARCTQTCTNPKKSVNLSFVCDAAGVLIGGLAFTDEELARLDAAAGTEIARLEEKQAADQEDKDRRTKTLREDLAYLSDNRLTLLRTGAYTPEGLAAEETRLKRELERGDEEPCSPAEIRETVAEVRKLSELLKTAKPYYDFAKPAKKEPIARLVFSELFLCENTLAYQCARGFRALERRILSECAHYDQLSELARLHHEIVDARTKLSAELESVVS
jgi:DNA invertase Pin-like site-specific DNA recombinase